MEKKLDNNMELCEQLIMVFSKDLREVFNRQAEDNNYLNRDDFECCSDRADAGIEDATKRIRKILSLAIAKENKENHKIDTSEEMDNLEKEMDSEQVAVARSSGWVN